ncbi:MAG: sulfite exporter TauE/SafE family protein [Betaproteobacteria bacterium]|nr:sulfite exporter TauE/SafE family protein [Betaproteobacteria bacterium]
MTFPDFPGAFYPVAIFAILLTGISKSGFGGGAGGVAVPLMSIFIAPPEAAGIMLPILCAMDIFGVHAYRGLASRAHLKVLLPGALVGIAVGALAFGALPVNVIRLLIGVIAVAFALNRWLRLTERLAARFDRQGGPPGPRAGRLCGALSGFTSTLAHAGGPPFSMWMLPQKLDKTTLVATSVVFFLVVNYVKLVPYAMLGQLNANNLAAALMFAPLAPLGIWLGVRVHRMMSDRVFYAISYTLLFATGVKLVWDGLHG